MQMPKGWRWLNRLSPATWIIYGLAVDQLGENTQHDDSTRWHAADCVGVHEVLLWLRLQLQMVSFP